DWKERRFRRLQEDADFVPLSTLRSPDGRFEVEVAGGRALAVVAGGARRPLDVELYSTFPYAVWWAGPDGLLVGPTAARLDLSTTRTKPLFAARGLRLGALSPSGERVLGLIHDRFVWYGSAGASGGMG